MYRLLSCTRSSVPYLYLNIIIEGFIQQFGMFQDNVSSGLNDVTVNARDVLPRSNPHPVLFLLFFWSCGTATFGCKKTLQRRDRSHKLTYQMIFCNLFSNRPPSVNVFTVLHPISCSASYFLPQTDPKKNRSCSDTPSSPENPQLYRPYIQFFHPITILWCLRTDSSLLCCSHTAGPPSVTQHDTNDISLPGFKILQYHRSGNTSAYDKCIFLGANSLSSGRTR